MPLGRRRARAAAGSALFLAVAPGVTAGLIPYLLTGWDADPAPIVSPDRRRRADRRRRQPRS